MVVTAARRPSQNADYFNSTQSPSSPAADSDPDRSFLQDTSQSLELQPVVDSHSSTRELSRDNAREAHTPLVKEPTAEERELARSESGQLKEFFSCSSTCLKLPWQKSGYTSLENADTALENAEESQAEEGKVNLLDSSPGFHRQESEEVEDHDEAFKALIEEHKHFNPSTNQTDDADALVTLSDKIMFNAENMVAENPLIPFYALTVLMVALIAVLGTWWYLVLQHASKDDLNLPSSRGGGGKGGRRLTTSDEADNSTLVDFPPGAAVYGYEYADAIFMALQVLTAAGFDDSIPDNIWLRSIYFFQILAGLIVFAILVGFITDSVQNFMNSLSEGKSKVVSDGHTLLLGWNEATVRLVCQLALLRRQFQQMNETWPRRLMPWLRAAPSTSVAAAPVVILCNSLTKEEMDTRLQEALAARGINPARTRVGRDIICRIGDPTDPHDLVRAGASRAKAICIMMTEEDKEEFDLSSGVVKNGATLRCLLALRYTLFHDEVVQRKGMAPDMRVVVELSHPCDYLDATGFLNREGKNAVYPVDLTVFKNIIMFSCTVKKGLAGMIMELISFDGVAIRRRKANEFRAGPRRRLGAMVGMTFADAVYEFEDGILIGTVDSKNPKSSRSGLIKHMDHIITDDDFLVFVSENSFPAIDPEAAKNRELYRAEASKIRKQDADVHRRQSIRASQSANFEKPRSIMVCGWRKPWTVDPPRFKRRIESLSASLSRGSSIEFLNAIPEEAFAEIMDQAGFIREPEDSGSNSWRDNHGVILRQTFGETTDPSKVQSILERVDVDTALVLGSHAKLEMPAKSCDTKVLSTILILRHVADILGGRNIHVVGENQLDVTSKLALGPRKSNEMGKASDFINAVAINARVLAQTLAYPIISESVFELFSAAPGNCHVDIQLAENILPTGQELTFGVVQELVTLNARDFDACAVCVGYVRKDGVEVYCPGYQSTYSFSRGEEIICVRRDSKRNSPSHMRSSMAAP